MNATETFNAYHLGDNLVTLHYLRALAKAYPDRHFIHYASPQYLAQLEPLTADIPNLLLNTLHVPTTLVPALPYAHDTWFGAGGFWYGQPDVSHWCAPALRYFAQLTARLGFPASANPLREPRDFLFDYPALQMPVADGGVERILVINSPPQSGQFSGFSHEGFDRLIAQLDRAGHNVITTSPSLITDIPCTQAQRMDVTAIGRLSQRCRAIIGVATGPMWTTFNKWNPTALRVLLNDRERVDILPEITVHANSLSIVPEILKDHGLL